MEIEDRLRIAGERFRAELTTSDIADPVEITEPLGPFRRITGRRWLVPVTTAIVVAFIAVSIGIARRDGPPIPSGSNPADLIGRDWQLTAVIQGGTTSSLSAADAKAGVMFESSTQMVGSDGCNGFSGRVTIRQATVTTHGVVSTTVGCGGDHDGHIDEVLLGDEFHWRIVYDRLVLDSGGIELQFTGQMRR